MFRTRLFGASLVLSILINIAILAAIGAFGPSTRFLPAQAPLKAIRLLVYHPPVSKPPRPATRVRLRRAKEARRSMIPHRIKIARATPAPPSAHPQRHIAASRPASSGRRPVRVAAAIRPTPPSQPARTAHFEQTARNVAPAPEMPKVVTSTQPSPLAAPAPSQDQGSSVGTNTTEPAPASGSAGGSGDYEQVGNAPGPGGNGGGGPFGIGPGGGGEGPRHIVYVLDLSPSMQTRIDRARQELRDALFTLEPEESFDIIAFGGENKLFADHLLPAGPKEVRSAINFLGSLDFIPGTDLQDALYSALSMQGVNVIVVITDGVPTMGETDFEKIARHVRKHNTRHARIYTIGLVGKNPDGTDQSFQAGQLLQQLAKDSGGDSRLVPLGEATPDDE
ncbi:MAG TPA: VWA domain-containing protein [Capsulimonadaceae bacterium]|nr:VWA domain-containing protein [Capsulimonadaceae bacterium]